VLIFYFVNSLYLSITSSAVAFFSFLSAFGAGVTAGLSLLIGEGFLLGSVFGLVLMPGEYGLSIYAQGQ
jgi:hypothetical protein